MKTILLASFGAEIVHGILSHRFGTDAYAAVTVGELVRGPVLLLFVGSAVLRLHDWPNRVALALLLALIALVLVQALAFRYSIAELFGTLLRGVRWLFVFFAVGFAAQQTRRGRLRAESVIGFIKRLVVVFYCVPIILAAVGIAGYSTYGDDSSRQGFVGFVMNNNVVASMLIFLLPFYVGARKVHDTAILIVYVVAGLLLGSKLVYGGFGLVFIVAGGRRMLAAARPRNWVLRRRHLAVVAVVMLLGCGLMLSPIPQRLLETYQSVREIYLSGGSGQENSAVDVLSSYRTLRLYAYLDWASRPENTLAVLIGGGLPAYTLLYAEVDWIDLASLFGMAGLAVFYGTLAYFWSRVWKLRHEPLGLRTLAMMSLALFVSLTSGHTFDGPVVGLVVGIVLGTFLQSAGASRGPLASRTPEIVHVPRDPLIVC